MACNKNFPVPLISPRPKMKDNLLVLKLPVVIYVFRYQLLFKYNLRKVRIQVGYQY